MVNLILGNCECVLKDFADESVDLIITDPPYGISYKSNRQKVSRKLSTEHNVSINIRESFFDRIENDKLTSSEWVSDAFRILKAGSALYIFCHWSKWSAWENAVSNSGFRVKNMIVINKSNHGMGDLLGDYAPKHELVLFATKGRHILNSETKRIPNVLDLPVIFSGSRRLHPNQKPESWIEPFVAKSSSEYATVLDPFMGSGVVGKVCERLNRNFIGIEISEQYFNIAKESMGK